MAKRRHKKARHGRRKRRLSAKQRRAIMRNLKKARRALRSKRRGHGKRRKSRKSRKHGKRRSSSRRHGGERRHGGLSNKAAQMYQHAIDLGRTPQQAYKAAARWDRMRSGKIKRYFDREAMEAKTKSQLANLFSGFGAAGHLAAQAR